MHAEEHPPEVVVAVKPAQLAGVVALLMAAWYAIRRRRGPG